MAIDEKKLIDALEDDMDSLFPRVFGKVHPNDAFGLYLELKAMIDNQPKISLENKTSDNDVPDTNVGKWIPCSEMLPNESGAYLVTINDYEPETIEAYYYSRIKNWGEIDGYDTYRNVIAWMPLPEPYKGEE